MNTPQDKSRVRWLQLVFSLRSLIVLVALLCCFIAWEMKIVKDRQDMIRLLRSHEAEVCTFEYARSEFARVGKPGFTEDKFDASVPKLRKWLGDEAVLFITAYPTISAEQFKRAKELFPEADYIDTLGYEDRQGNQRHEPFAVLPLKSLPESIMTTHGVIHPRELR